MWDRSVGQNGRAAGWPCEASAQLEADVARRRVAYLAQAEPAFWTAAGRTGGLLSTTSVGAPTRKGSAWEWNGREHGRDKLLGITEIAQ